jgi:hypothetical protein
MTFIADETPSRGYIAAARKEIVTKMSSTGGKKGPFFSWRHPATEVGFTFIT